MRIFYSSEIFAPTEVVFPWLAEPDRAMKWQKNVKGGEILINKPEITGTTFKEVIEENGKSLEMYGMITKYEKNKIIAFHLKSRIHEFDISYSLAEISSATRISLEAVIRWKFPMNVVSLFAGKKIENGIRRQLESEILELKRLCEAGQPTRDNDRSRPLSKRKAL